MGAKEIGLTLEFSGIGKNETGGVVAVEGNNAPAVKVGDTLVRIDPSYFRTTEVQSLLG